ncbi:MAG: hypothetical protein K1X55_13970 [Chitinophagales bacterium]|nr:hypothetical protein [Chitinophagales bacterium]
MGKLDITICDDLSVLNEKQLLMNEYNEKSLMGRYLNRLLIFIGILSIGGGSKGIFSFYSTNEENNISLNDLGFIITMIILITLGCISLFFSTKIKH